MITTRGIFGAAVVALAALMTVIGLTASAPAETGRTPLEAYVDNVRANLHLPGLAVAVLDDGTPVEEVVAGDDGDGSPFTRDTPVMIGSVAKSMTATLVLQQVDAGRLRLDDTVGDHLSWIVPADTTVEQLLTHTSGYTAADGLAVSERFDDEPGAVRRAAQDLELSGRVGQYAYSSANYLVLGAVVEQVTDRPFGEVLRDDLLTPLGMDDTSGLAAGGRGLAAGHRWWFGRPVAHRVGTDESGAPFGYVVSTLADLERYAAAQTGTDPDVLPPASLERLHEPRVESDDDRYGLGWRVKGSGDDVVVHHTGATPGFFTHVLVRPSDGRSVVVAADAYGEAQAPALAAIAHDALRISDGEGASPSSADPLLGAVPWTLAAVALAGLAVVGVTVRGARSRLRSTRRRVVTGVLALLVALVLLAVPPLLGSTLSTLVTWAPDVALALGSAVVAWLLAAGALLVSSRATAAGDRLSV